MMMIMMMILYFVSKRKIKFLFYFSAKQNENLQKNTGIHRQQLLQLALDWDALAIAKEQIIKDDLNDLDVIITESN